MPREVSEALAFRQADRLLESINPEAVIAGRDNPSLERILARCAIDSVCVRTMAERWVDPDAPEVGEEDEDGAGDELEAL